MVEITLVLLALIGGLSLLFAALAAIGDYLLTDRKPWKPQATYRRRP